MIWIQANSLDLILKVTEIILEKNIFPSMAPNYPLEVSITRSQLDNLEDSLILWLYPDIIIGNIRFWDSSNKKYLEVSYDSSKRLLVFNGNSRYVIADPDSSRPLYISKC